MSVRNKSYGQILYFAQEGETVESVTVSNAAAGKPAASDFSTWRELGCIESHTPQVEREGGEVTTCFNPTTAKYDREAPAEGEIVTLYLDFTLKQLDDLIISLSHAANEVDGSDNFVPGSGDGRVKGWARVQVYEVGNTTPVILLDVWCELMVTTPATMARQVGQATVRLEVLTPASDTANQGTLAGGLAAA